MHRPINQLFAVVVALVTSLACTVSTPLPPEDAGTPAPQDPAVALLTNSPGEGATGVALSTELALVFSRPVVATSVVVGISPTAPLATPVADAEGTEVRVGATLAAATRYTVTVTATGTDGRPLTGASSFSFTTQAAADTTAPTLMSASPADQATAVASNATVRLTFSEAMNAGSFTASVTPEAPFTAAWSSQDSVVTLSFTAPLTAATQYQVQYGGADLAGNGVAGQLTFTTATPADTEAPAVKVTAPEAMATNVPTNATWSLTFSESMDKATVDAAISIVPAVAGTVLWDATGVLRSFQPTAPLAASTQYTVTVGVGAKDLAGNALAAPFSFSFTTAAAPDTTAPTLVSSNPAAGANGVILSTNISLTFSEPMDKASAQVAFSVTLPPNVTGAFSWSADGKTMTFNPANNFLHGQIATWRITTGAKDLAGNALANQISRGFELRKLGTVVLDSVAALDGYATNASSVVASSGNLLVGDSNTNLGYRSFLSFDLSTIPANAIGLTRADLFVFLSGWQGNPRSTLGGQVKLERVDFGAALEAADYDRARFMNVADSLDFGPAIESQGWKVSQATLFAVGADFSDRAARSNRSQFRLRFPQELSGNGQADMYTYHSGNSLVMSCPRQAPAMGTSCKPYLVVSYEYP